MNNRLALARLQACKDSPYMRAGFMALIPQAAPGLGTVAVTAQWALLFDPAFVETCSTAELAAALTHEVMHLLLKHHARAKALGVTPEQAETWNIAADAAINENLTHLLLPPDCVYPHTLGLAPGNTAEGYYRQLLEKQEKQKKQGNQGKPENPQNQQKQGQSFSQCFAIKAIFAQKL